MPDVTFSHQTRREEGLPLGLPPKEPHTRLCHRQTGSGYGEVASISPAGEVTIRHPAYLDHLCQSDMLALLKAMAPRFTDQTT